MFLKETGFILSVLCLSLALLSSAKAEDQQPRLVVDFDFDWRFSRSDPKGAESMKFDGSNWRKLNVPHDWSVEHPFDENFASSTGFLPGGIGWYRKEFDVPADWADKEVSIEFDGVYRNSMVWLNGQLLGKRPNGYASFSYRLTPHIKARGKNVIAVRVAREEVADSRWYPGSGIYRHVKLVVTEPLHFARHGIFVRVPRVTDERADITAEMKVVNRSKKPTDIRLESSVIDPNGKLLSSQSINGTLPPKSEKEFAHWHLVKNPKKWSVDDPNLYQFVTKIFEEDQLRDVVTTPIGLRSFHFDPNLGFFLNGNSMKLKGLCLHHDAGALGAAVPDEVLERRLRLVKSIGGNAVRCSHNPMAAEFYDICDRIGLLVMDEAFDEWELGKRKWVNGRNVGRAKRAGYNLAFEEWAERDLAEMILRSRNHPSVIMWSIGNEIDYPGDPYDHPEFFDPAAPPVDEGSPSATRLSVVAPRLISTVKRHDSTRPVTMALSNTPTANGIGLPDMLDVVGYNYQEKFYSQDHANHPGRIILGSENGKGLRSWRSVVENDYISGQFLWVGFDFLGEADEWPNHGSRWGVFDTRGFIKQHSDHYYQTWASKPMVKIIIPPSRFSDKLRRSHSSYPRSYVGSIGEKVTYLIDSNCDSCRLKLNGKEIPLKDYDRKLDFAEFNYQPGELVLEGIQGGKVVAVDRITSYGTATKLQLTADREEIAADGKSTVHIEVQIIDDSGYLVPLFREGIRCSVEGNGRLLAIDNGNQNDPTPLASKTKSTHDGRLMAYVQSKRKPGKIVIRATADGLEEAEITIESR